MGKTELASHQIEYGDEIDAGAKASSLTLNGAEDTVESFHKGAFDRLQGGLLCPREIPIVKANDRLRTVSGSRIRSQLA